MNNTKESDLFERFKNSVLNVDPVNFIENNLTLDGKPFKVNANGYKPFADIYRYICLQAINPDAKPVVLVKGRQVGATTMAAALEAYFCACGLYGNNGRSPMRIMHLFPTLALAAAYTKDKLQPIITQSKPVPGLLRSNGINKSFMESKMDTSSPANDNQHFKKFLGGNQVWIESTGLTGDRIRGRMQSLETEFPTPDRGFIKLKNLKEGDKLFDENGDICSIVKLHPIDYFPKSYKITFDDETQVEVCEDHLWLTYTKKDRNIKNRNNYKIKRRELRRSLGKKYKPSVERSDLVSNPTVKSTKEILNTLKCGKESNHSIPIIPYVKYEKKELLIDPYILGLWLGDGNSLSGIITSADPEVFEGYDHHIIPSSVNVYNAKAFSKDGYSKANNYRIPGLTTKLNSLNLINNKHIPDIYLQSSYEQRLALLQGLMDTDGCCYKGDGRCEFTQIVDRECLVFQVKELISSLGIKCRIQRKKSMRYDIQYKDKYQLIFSTNKPVFKLKRKLKNQNHKETTKKNHRFIKSIDSIPPIPMRCITVDSPSHLYLITKSFIPTHNTVDVLFYDEIQDMSALSIGTAGKVATKAQYGPIGQGVQVFFGTPKQKGGAYWKMWQSSNQQYYHLGCEKCGEYFPLYRPDVNWEEIWLYGFTVKCTKCGHEQDKVEATNRGKWIGVGDKLDHQMIGYHINQLYIPDFPKEKIIAQKPENSPTNTERVYMNEVLGEFFDGEGGTISKQEIHDKCGDPGRKFSKIITPSDKVKVYAGFDWGQKANLDTIIGKRQGQSYSCAVILTAIGPKLFSVEFATRLTKNDPAEKRNIVEEMFRRYSVQLAVGDIGDAGDLTHDLQRTYGDMFLGSRANANVNGHIKFDKDIFPKVINFEKDYYISELLSLLKEGAIKFPYGSYNQVEWLVDHCCSMEIKVTSDRGGDPIRRFVKGSTPNDGLMALLNAYLAWKFDVSQGFKIKHPGSMNYESSQNQSSLSPIIGYCPDW